MIGLKFRSIPSLLNHSLLLVCRLAGGRLFDHVVIMDNLNEQMAIRYVKELLMALNYLHKNSIAHLDVKPENILLTGGESPSVVLSDFGDATRLSRRVPYQHQLAGNPEFAGKLLIFHMLEERAISSKTK